MNAATIKFGKFDSLCSVVQGCLRCSRMAGSARVLNRSAGSISAPIMFVGEAPGRLGADSSEIPFHGDKSGHNFEELLEFSGLTRESAFVTNAVLCNPKDPKGNNAPPNSTEIGNCHDFLKQQIDIVNPSIVVTLGGTALRATSLVEAHELSLSAGVRTANRWYDRLLIPLYHPGQRAMIHRSFANQRADYQFVAEQLKRIGGQTRASFGKTKAEIAAVADVIISAYPELSYFALHKLFYLVECAHTKQHGERLTKAYFIRQKDGPYCVDLHFQKLQRALPHIGLKGKKGYLFVRDSQQDLFGAPARATSNVTGDVLEEIQAVVEKCKGLKDSELKTKVYLTTPMKRILREESRNSVNMFNSPIYFADATN